MDLQPPRIHLMAQTGQKFCIMDQRRRRDGQNNASHRNHPDLVIAKARFKFDICSIFFLRVCGFEVDNGYIHSERLDLYDHHGKAGDTFSCRREI